MVEKFEIGKKYKFIHWKDPVKSLTFKIFDINLFMVRYCSGKVHTCTDIKYDKMIQFDNDLRYDIWNTNDFIEITNEKPIENILRDLMETQ